MSILGIGIPVYNSESSIESIIECLLKQSFQDFEVHIFDNCSSDNTVQIAEKYAKKDARFFIHKNSINVGMAENFNNCLKLKNYKDFKYISIKSANDRIYPTYYEKCINFLDNNSDFCLCYSEGTNTVNGIFPMLSYEQENVYERVEKIIQTLGVGNMNYGVIRANIIDKIVPIKHIQGFDHIFFLNLAMIGKLKKLNEILYDREPPINRTEDSYRNSCCSNISGRIITIPHFIELTLGYIDFCNECFLNNLDRTKIIKMVIDISMKERFSIMYKQYNDFKKTIKNKKNLNEADFITLKEYFHKLRYYLLKNKKFALTHPKDTLQGLIYRLIF